MSRKFVFIGAGSPNFSRALARDILSFPAFADATIALVDIDRRALEDARVDVQRIIDAGHYPAKLIATTDRTEVMEGADGVVSMLMAQPLEVFKNDLYICEKYGVKINVGDTRNPAGIFRFLRTAPVLMGIVDDIKKYCPNAVFLNYSNPMAMLCRAIQEAAPEITTTGLCHSVQGGIAKFASILNIPKDEISYLCAGINHLAFYLKLEHNGEDLYPALRKITLENQAVYDEDIVRNEMFLAMGYYVTESSGHFSEYSPWFRKTRCRNTAIAAPAGTPAAPTSPSSAAKSASPITRKPAARRSPSRSISSAARSTPPAYSTPSSAITRCSSSTATCAITA